MQTTALRFPSAGGGTVHAVIVAPAGEPKATVQFVHGMAEYIERYLPTMEALAEKGYLCCGHDHFGHGKSVTNDAALGHLDFKNGANHMIEDVKTVADHLAETYTDIPHVLFGHSMGSFVVRCAAARYENAFDGLIVCGTGGPNPALGAGKALAATLRRVKGDRGYSPFLYNIMFGAYNARCKEDTDFAWLSVDPANVDAYEMDPLCGFPFTIGGIHSLLNVHGEANGKACFAATPKDLPVLLIAGTDDPVGEYGDGVKTVFGEYKRAGVKKVTLKLYENTRHEILNDVYKARVITDMCDWLDEIINA